MTLSATQAMMAYLRAMCGTKMFKRRSSVGAFFLYPDTPKSPDRSVFGVLLGLGKPEFSRAGQRWALSNGTRYLCDVFVAKSRAMKPRSLSFGFTVVEILVVIAILAILASILLAVFSRVRENARQASCQNNLRQIALAVQQYTQDNNGSLPAAPTDFSFLPGLQSPQLLRCPSAEAIPVTPLTTAPSAFFPDYYSNFNLRKVVVGLPLMGIEESKVIRPASTVLVGDGYLWSEDGSFKGYSVGQPQGSGSVRHSGGANYAFCDGHIKWLRPEQISSDCPDREANPFTFCVR